MLLAAHASAYPSWSQFTFYECSTILKFAEDTLVFPFTHLDYGWCREPVALNFFGVDSEEYYLFLSLAGISVIVL